ncbi:MAG: glycosyltransferase [Actinobacteria bacterium]|nr:glycosyltransferase [Actinomycetota bacterium]
MKIAWISSWPPRHCGIATYSLELTTALKSMGHEVHIICHTDGGSKEEKNIYPIINTQDCLWNEVVYQTVDDIKPDVVHIQHEYALYATNNDYSTSFLRPLFRWKIENNFPTIITYHSVFTTLNLGEKYFMNLSLDLASAGIVHEEYQKIYLPMNIGRVPNNVYVIPHGAKSLFKYKDTKTHLHLENKKVIGMIGWWEPNKGFEKIVKLWPDIIEKIGQEWILLVAGDARPGSTSGQIYKPELLKAIEDSSAKDRIKTIIGMFSPEKYDEVLSVFDMMILPYSQASQSGNLAHAFALGVPAVVTDLEGLGSEIRASNAGIAVSLNDKIELKNAIINMANNDELRKHYAKNAEEYVTEKIVWSNVAHKHTQLYQNRIEQLQHETTIETNGHLA